MWSDELQKETREFISKYGMAAMKHFGNSVFGVCIVKDGKYLIKERDSDNEHLFESIEELVEAGWAID